MFTVVSLGLFRGVMDEQVQLWIQMNACIYSKLAAHLCSNRQSGELKSIARWNEWYRVGEDYDVFEDTMPLIIMNISYAPASVSKQGSQFCQICLFEVWGELYSGTWLRSVCKGTETVAVTITGDIISCTDAFLNPVNPRSFTAQDRKLWETTTAKTVTFTKDFRTGEMLELYVVGKISEFFIMLTSTSLFKETIALTIGVP